MKHQAKSIIWSDYQKTIPADGFYYLRSCIRQNFFPGSERAFLQIMQNDLGKDVFDDPKHTTCTGIAYHSDLLPFETLQTVVARQFALMSEAGYRNLAVSCVTSFGIYSEVLETWKEFPDEMEKARTYLRKATGRELAIPENVAHCSDIFYHFRNEIAARLQYPLINGETGQPLKIVEHIGCHYAKMFPGKGVGGAEFSCVLSGMIEAWGGEVVDYPERRHCCGFGFRQYLIMANRGYSVSNSKKKFESMEPYRPDAIICNCPGCTMFLDKWQYTIGELEGKTYGGEGRGIPVLTYEELAGLALGYDPWDLGLQMHQVDCEPLLQKMGIKYNPGLKYRGLKGEDLGKPVIPNCFNRAVHSF
ncbi:heterodisulfide reductase-related iron-sulfur binding cluster [Gaoshiqia sediminis]|uniref:Heterodisulfide reductase-related iron-sulfur binding cluster n=1 Tax=Gaoshiqia sediminis TaxID=2986998 RepID=A0AA42C7J1_9BACT|nr:heterodisulfide reductase-related iron-sulfur binding cluster [Gaoshiqia sediminis]MCW0483619.1 heterodisulfide reductase-related iron-sulfur binding cluster [Gaoshiqia sediminis]